MSERVLPFEGVENFRDYGDYVGASGRRIVRRKLLRSGHHARASDQDLEKLQALQVDVVVDLRRPSERKMQPSRRPEGFSGSVLESDLDDGGEAPHMQFLRTTDLTADSVREFMVRTYESMPFDPRHLDLFGGYFDALARVNGAVLIHCAAGKDRTGFLAALTHHVMGVSDADVIEDYLLTNSAVRLEERAPQVAKLLEENFGRKAADAAVRAFLGVEPEYLRTAFDAVTDRFGSVDRYLEDALGVDAGKRDRLVERLSA